MYWPPGRICDTSWIWSGDSGMNSVACMKSRETRLVEMVALLGDPLFEVRLTLALQPSQDAEKFWFLSTVDAWLGIPNSVSTWSMAPRAFSTSSVTSEIGRASCRERE